MVIVLFIRSHVYNLIGNTRILWIALVNLTVWCLYEAVLIDSCIACKRVDQSDIRSLRSLDRAHSSVMRIMNVSYFESGTVS